MHIARRFSQKRLNLAAIPMALVILLVIASPTLAVKFGELDGTNHPHVGLLVFDVDGSPTWRCSGTLLSPTVMLTAGHCTFGTSGGRVWFESNVDAGIPGNGYPSGGGTSIEFAEIHTHPQYDDEAFYRYDAGVVILSQPVNLGNYGALANIGLLDNLATKRGQKDQSFTVVGYGLQSVKPTLQEDQVRYKGTVKLISVEGTAGTSASFTNNPGKGNGEGGTCFGDSGGPIFYGDSNVIAAITSYGLNANCAGMSGGYRVDTVDDQDFINQFLD